MVYWSTYPWYFDPPTHGITNPLLRYYEPLSFGRNEGGQFAMRGFKIQWWKIDPGWKYHMVFWPRGQYTMGVKIPYDTRVWCGLCDYVCDIRQIGVFFQCTSVIAYSPFSRPIIVQKKIIKIQFSINIFFLDVQLYISIWYTWSDYK